MPRKICIRQKCRYYIFNNPSIELKTFPSWKTVANYGTKDGTQTTALVFKNWNSETEGYISRWFRISFYFLILNRFMSLSVIEKIYYTKVRDSFSFERNTSACVNIFLGGCWIDRNNRGQYYLWDTYHAYNFTRCWAVL